MNRVARFLSNFYWQMGVDLGSSKIAIFVKDKGIVIEESSVVAKLKRRRGGREKYLVFGQKAKEMINREPKIIEVVSPISRGVVADLEAAEALVGNYLRLVYEIPGGYPKIFKPKVVVAVSSLISEVQRRAVASVFKNAGVGEVRLVDSGVAGALGSGFGVGESGGLLVLDIGGSKTEVSLVSMGGLVIGRGIGVGGEDFDEAIINYIKMKYGLLIGKNSAEKLKIEGGGVVRGRDLESNLPKSIRVSMVEIREAVALQINKIIRLLKEVLDEMPTEMTDDVLKRGVIMMGGASQFGGMAKLLEEELKMNAVVVEEPSAAVVRGCGLLLEEGEYGKILAA